METSASPSVNGKIRGMLRMLSLLHERVEVAMRESDVNLRTGGRISGVFEDAGLVGDDGIPALQNEQRA